MAETGTHTLSRTAAATATAVIQLVSQVDINVKLEVGGLLI